jgi:regulator of protease activity HflC (stomatin/prohibitin superfamily)
VSVPDDVADWLKQQADVSGAITEAVREQMRAARIDEILRAAGLDLAEADERRWRPADRPPDLLAEGRRTLANRPTGG